MSIVQFFIRPPNIRNSFVKIYVTQYTTYIPVVQIRKVYNDNKKICT